MRTKNSKPFAPVCGVHIVPAQQDVGTPGEHLSPKHEAPRSVFDFIKDEKDRTMRTDMTDFVSSISKKARLNRIKLESLGLTSGSKGRY